MSLLKYSSNKGLLYSFIDKMRNLLASSTGRDISLVYSGKVIEAVIAMAASVLVARGLDDPARMGEVTLVVSFATILNGLMGYGLDVTGVKFISDARVTKPGSVAEIVWNIVVVRIVFIIVISFIAYFTAGPIIAKYFKTSTNSDLIVLGISIASASSLFSVVQSVMRGHRKFGLIFTTNTIGRLSRLLFLGGCIFLGVLNVRLVIFSNLVAAIVILCGGIFCWKRIDLSFSGAKLSKEVTERIMKYSFWMYVAILLNLLFTYMNVGMLSVLGTVSAIGFYAVADTVLRPFEFFPETLNQVFLPRMSEIHDRKGLVKFCRRVLIFGSCVAFTLLPVIIFPEYIIRFIYGARYIDGAPVLRLLAGYIALNIILNPLYLFAHRLNLPRLFTIGNALSLSIGIVANLILIPRYGEQGCAMTMLIVGVSTQLMLVPFILRRASIAFPKVIPV